MVLKNTKTKPPVNSSSFATKFLLFYLPQTVTDTATVTFDVTVDNLTVTLSLSLYQLNRNEGLSVAN